LIDRNPASFFLSKITLVHGFYAAMGGFAIKSQFLDPVYHATPQGRLTLTKEGIVWLLQKAPEVFPSLSEDEILDKSKASTLIKALTCLQAFWFCLQCVMRLTMNTSIGLLELNVFGHCICTFIIYAIWWDKPMDVAEPTLLRIEDRLENQSLIALLCSYEREVPVLPSPLDECCLWGEEYYGEAKAPPIHYNAFAETQYSNEERYLNSLLEYRSFSRQFPRSADDNVSPNLQHNHRTRSSLLTDNNEEYIYKYKRGPEVLSDEEEIYEYAGLGIERLGQLLKLHESDPQM